MMTVLSFAFLCASYEVENKAWGSSSWSANALTSVAVPYCSIAIDRVASLWRAFALSIFEIEVITGWARSTSRSVLARAS